MPFWILCLAAACAHEWINRVTAAFGSLCVLTGTAGSFSGGRSYCGVHLPAAPEEDGVTMACLVRCVSFLKNRKRPKKWMREQSRKWQLWICGCLWWCHILKLLVASWHLLYSKRDVVLYCKLVWILDLWSWGEERARALAVAELGSGRGRQPEPALYQQKTVKSDISFRVQWLTDVQRPTSKGQICLMGPNERADFSFRLKYYDCVWLLVSAILWEEQHRYVPGGFFTLFFFPFSPSFH